MKKPHHMAIWLLLLLCATLPAGASGISADFSMGMDVLRGKTVYQIGGNVLSRTGGAYTVHFPLSELEFPLNLCMISGEATLGLGARLFVCLNGKINVNSDPGQIEDSDWLTSPTTLDIYSESQAVADALMVSANLRYKVYTFREITLLAGVGCRYQGFSFEAGNTLQYYPASTAPPDFLAGQTLAYEIAYLIPYGEIAVALVPGKKAGIEFSLGYSPWATATDEDHHLLKNRISECDYEGDAFMAAMKARYDITEHLFAALRCEMLMIKGAGEAVTYENGIWNHTIEQTTESRQSTLGISAGYRF